MEQPELGWTTPVKIDRVVDGDTIVIKVEKTITIRLQDDDGFFDTPETYRPKSEEERILGKAYTQFVKDLLESADSVVMHLGADESGKVANLFTIGTRAKAHIFADGIDIAEEVNRLKDQIESGANE